MEYVYTEKEFIRKVTGVMREYVKEVYNLEFDVPVRLCGRLKKTIGYFEVKVVNRDTEVGGVYYREGEEIFGTKVICFNRDLLTATNTKMLEDIAKHEATHYALYKLGKPYLDEDEYFQAELRRNNIIESNVEIAELGMTRRLYVWVCVGCRGIVRKGGKTRKDYTKEYQSKCCGAEVEDVGWQYIRTGKEKIYI